MAKSKFFRVAVEGATVDGRVIQRDWLEQMAASYDPATYTARINCEHIAGFSPDRPFNAYGSVLSLRTEQVELTISGEKKTLLALYAEIEANDQLLEINKAGQKLFTSCEIHTDFAGGGQAYLVGLALTDQPASLGTEVLKFAAQSRPNAFTPALETTVELASAAEGRSIAEAIAAGFASLGTRFTRSDEKPQQPAPQTPPPANDNPLDIAAFTTALGDQVAAAIKPVAEETAALRAELKALKTQLETTEQPAGFTRTPATGGGNAIVTDC